MKKFKTKTKYNYVVIVLLIILFSLFIVSSFTKLNKSNPTLIRFLTKDFSDDTRLNLLTNNLDYLINNYSFKEEDFRHNK